MTGRESRPRVYSIAAHRGFADALVAGLVPRYAQPGVGLARLTLLLPSRRTARTVTEAFVRHAGESGSGGLLLPRLVTVGDLDLDEALGPLLDPLGAADVPPAADPTRRWLRLAELLGADDPARPGPALLREADSVARTIDRLLVEDIDPAGLVDDAMVAIVGEQAGHWRTTTARFLRVHAMWRAELDARGEVDPPRRRNALFARAAAAWRAAPPPGPVVAAGVTSASPALARLLRVVSELPGGSVILPDFDLALDPKVWDALGSAGVPDAAGAAPIGRDDAVTHPQYHLKVLLNRMGINRAEVRPWHRAGMTAAPPERSRAISNLFLPPAASAAWADLPDDRRRLSGVRLLESAHPGEEAQAIAVLIREALGVPEKRVALVTPDRGLASRVVGHLQRWGIAADDSAGVPLAETPAGRLFLLLAAIAAEDAAPVPLLAALAHPLVARGDGRAAWLDHVRALDRALRGPRPAPGLAGIAQAESVTRNARLAGWWQTVMPRLAPLLDLTEPLSVAGATAAIVVVAEDLAGSGLWENADGRALAGLVDELQLAAGDAPGPPLARADLAAALGEAAARVAVRPPWGGHPRVAIYGLLEARMSRADLVICGGLTEGVWPAAPSPEPLLPPALLRALGIPGGDFRIGLAAHDLAAALGAPEVVLSWAARDAQGPAIRSRFVLRVEAMLGARLADAHRETRIPALARALDDAPAVAPHPRPEPMPSAEQRRVSVAATALDRLRSDPYQFYASAILRLRKLDPRDAEPSPAWRGTAVHKILERWHEAGGTPGDLHGIAEAALDAMSAHPLMRSLWQPRLLAALDWVEDEIAVMRGQGRIVLGTEVKGDIEVLGVRVHGRADRIDRTGDGTVAIVDYKTGMPPSPAMVEDGFALQLGVLGLIARAGGFEELAAAEPDAFEYWSLARARGGGFGYVASPVRTPRMRRGLALEDVLPETERYLREALGAWIVGDAPFTARLNPDLPGYSDFDQLMRLDEWIFDLGRRPA